MLTRCHVALDSITKALISSNERKTDAEVVRRKLMAALPRSYFNEKIIFQMTYVVKGRLSLKLGDFHFGTQ